MRGKYWNTQKWSMITTGRPEAMSKKRRNFSAQFKLETVLDGLHGVLNTVASLTEMPRHGRGSFCCGAQFWKEEEHGAKAVNVERYEEAKATDVLAVGCPFCMQMFETAKSSVPDGPVVKDIVELIADGLPVMSNDKQAEAAD